MIFFVGLPYAAIAIFIVGLVWRYRSHATISSRSSQLLESRWIAWGAVPFHLGITIVLIGHLVPLLIPDLWQSWMSNRTILLTTETIGAAGGILCLAGLIVLFVRRVATLTVRASSDAFDLILLLVLIAQVVLGLQVAFTERWAAVWAARVTTPYLWSIFTLRPDPAFLTGAPQIVQLHVILAWITLALVPFTRLVHMFALPVRYLFRSPQRMIEARRM